ncbi:MAG: hypothetical protein IT548_06960 [Alphaproteobacteria bacterium]|nr:hypothetical protein [Alphaproteobacteria bacterium]
MLRDFIAAAREFGTFGEWLADGLLGLIFIAVFVGGVAMTAVALGVSS